MISESTQHISVGLALGGGVIRGIAHMGVIAILEKAKIPIDFVAGTSIGALIGGIYCAGVDMARARILANSLNWFELASITWPRRGIFSFSKMEAWLNKNIGDIDIQDLPRPFAAVTTDLDTGEEFVLREGKLAQAIRASCSIPGLVVPKDLDGRQLGDGSLVNSVPVSVAREMGASYVIGVDIFMPTVREGWGAIGYGLDALEILVRQAGGGFDNANRMIVPDLAGMTYLRFSKIDEIYQRGCKAAENALPAILNDLLFRENIAKQSESN
jgi:NTE family protein